MSDEKAVIAWNKIGIMQAVELAQLQDVAGEVQLLSAMIQKGVAKAEHYERLLALSSPENQMKNINQQMAMMAKYVVSVPVDWLIEGAPAVLDWGKPESYAYLQTGKFRQLYQSLMFGGISGVEISKN